MSAVLKSLQSLFKFTKHNGAKNNLAPTLHVNCNLAIFKLLLQRENWGHLLPLKILLKSSDIDVKFIDKIQVEWHNQLEKRVKEKFISLNLAISTSQKGIFK